MRLYFFAFFYLCTQYPPLERLCSIFRKIGRNGHIFTSQTPIIALIDPQDSSDHRQSRDTQHLGQHLDDAAVEHK